MESYPPISTGHQGIDRVIDGLRLGDNVVWQTDNVEDFAEVVAHFVRQARIDGRKIVYCRFGSHRPLIDDAEGIQVHRVDPSLGFESFASSVYQMITKEGLGAFFVFDVLTDLLRHWGSDLMVMNFFKVTCPYLYELDTVAYFCLLRGEHSFDAVAGIRETTQLLLDLHNINDTTYVHAHKAWSRYSPTMFFPHRVDQDAAVPVTSSAETSELFGKIGQQELNLDPWRALLESAREALNSGDVQRQRQASDQLIGLLIGREGPMVQLAARHLGLADLLAIAGRRIGSGRIGGKSAGMLVAGAIVAADPELAEKMEAPDSYYLGSDLFFTYIIDNGWWKDWMEQKTAGGYYLAGEHLYHKLRHGQFPPVIRERFLRLLEYFGQSPIIVRSSSLLEDNFGNAFSGKYESVFCAGQGTPDDRLRAFEEAVRVVYASAMGTEALRYREHRNLSTDDEQMSILVQRVSGNHHGHRFFPNAAGVGYSHNLYVFAPDIDPSAGALRLVVGLGTRAVDRLGDDYARLVALDRPLRLAVDASEAGRYSQKMADVLDLAENTLVSVPLSELADSGSSWPLFLSVDRAQVVRLRELGRRSDQIPQICDFSGLLGTDFTSFMRKLLARLTAAYDYPIDIEFTVNIIDENRFRVCLVQCRPLQTRGVGSAVRVPKVDAADCLIVSEGGFIGGNVEQKIDKVIYVRPERYLELGQTERYEVARVVGVLNQALAAESVMAIGPGRWGTSTPALGVPVHFADINNMAVLVEVTDPALDFNVDLSFGSHFFSDLVETGIFFIALDQLRSGVLFQPDLLTARPNRLEEYFPGSSLERVVHVVECEDMTVYSDILSQRLICHSVSLEGIRR